MDGGDTQAAISAGTALGAPRSIGERNLFTIVPEGGEVAYLKHETDTPERPTGSVSLFDADSFVTYVAAFAGSNADHGLTRIYADKETGAIVAVLNDHKTGSDAGFGDHRAVLTLRMTPEWKAWTEKNNRPLPQVEFARFIEDHIPEIVTPAGAELFEIAKSIEGSKGAAFKSGVRLDNGQVRLKYEETVTAKAGEKGELEIPESFTLGLKPYEGSDAYQVAARFRYRIADEGVLSLFYTLDRPHVILESAFADVLAKIKAALPDTPALSGTARGKH